MYVKLLKMCDLLQIQVAIKCLSKEHMQNNPMDFLKEACIMHTIEHQNIVRLYGVVLNTHTLMLVSGASSRQNSLLLFNTEQV